MLSVQINDIGLVFIANIDGSDIAFKDWSETDDCIYYYPLATLVDNGNAQLNRYECIVPFDSIYLLDDEEKCILGVPTLYNRSMRLRGESMLNCSDFAYRLELLHSVPDGELLPFERNHNIISYGTDKYLLSEEQYKLFIAVDAYNNTSESEKNTEFNLRQFSNIKALAISAKCQLDSYLENENVFVPDKIKLEINHDGTGYKIIPSVDIEEKDKFVSTYDKMRKAQSVYPVQKQNGERVRVVLSSEQRKTFELLKERNNKYKSKEEIGDLITNPIEYFDPEQFDLSDFYSDRVIEIGVYKPKFYPFVSPYKSCWIVGATIECPESGTAKVTIEDMESLLILEQGISIARENNEPIVSYKGVPIDITDAEYFAQIGRKQLESPNSPIDKEENSNNEHKVLIIEENAEDLGFSAEKKTIEAESKYILFNNPNLDKDFKLKAHQEEGIAWLQHLYNKQANGCLMADDMGLGKTLQILYFIDWHSRIYPNHKPYLIVAPISLLENWENEYNRFFNEPRLKIAKLSSKSIPRKFDKSTIDYIQKMDIVLTNYESLRISQLNFCAVEFDVVILDEAQKIKSPGTLVTNASKALKCNFKIAMTGTPVENSLLDLWCIMDFCVPGLLGNAKEFASKYQTPLKNSDTDLITLGNDIHNKLGIFFMRRLKQDVAKDLPQKIERKESIEMPLIQENEYMEIVKQYNKGIQPNMLLTLMGIREVSEHPYLHNSTLLAHETNDLVETSARLLATIFFLDNIKEKQEKVILFAERKDSQKMLQRIVAERYRIIAKIINGDTPSVSSKNNDPNKQSRQESIDDFQTVSGFNIIIMSPIAAGMGLNVTGANHVIHYSRHWNPAKENQATDRAYRIGQTKDVFVYYPMAVSKSFKSFDETLDELLNRKTSLASSTIFPTERTEVTQEELGRMIFENQ